MSIFDGLNLMPLEPEPDPCTICARDATNGPAYCGCQVDQHGNVTVDCGRCSDGLVCVDCDNQFSGLAVSIGVFY